MSAGIALARQPSSPRRLPTIERDRDADFINCIPLTHSGRGQEVAQSPVEPHRGSDHDTSISRGTRKPLEDSQNGRLFRCHIQIVNRRAEHCINDRPRRIDERPRTIDDRHCAGHCSVKRGGIIHRSHAHFRSRVSLPRRFQFRSVTTRKDGCKSAFA